MGSALDVSTSLGDLVDGSNIDFSGHIPVITIALSSIREIQLLADDKTTCLSSVKNIALDATGAGVGGAVGAKAGAIVGGVVAGPVGALLGGVLGAVGCAIGGRNITNKIKRIPLNNAIEARELIKITVLETAPGNAKELANVIANSTNSEVVQTVGNKITLFRQKKKNSRIEFPR